MTKYFSEKVVEVGELANNKSDNLLISFGMTAPAELKEYCLIFLTHSLMKDIDISDYLIIDDQEYKITAVGNRASEQLREIGHLTIYFDGLKDINQSGAIRVSSTDYPIFNINSTITFESRENS